MAELCHTVRVELDAVDEALLGALAAKHGIAPDELAGALLAGALQGIGDAALSLEVDDDRSH